MEQTARCAGHNSRRFEAYHSDFADDWRRSVQEDCVIHIILDAHTLNLLLKLPSGLLPGSVVNLNEVFDRGPEHKGLSVKTTKAK